MKSAIATWSGGKDSCFATYLAMQQGYAISHIANTISFDYQRVRFHGLPAEIIKRQSELIDIPLLQAETTPKHYEDEFKANLQRGITQQTTGIVFGDIHLQDCLKWATKVCNDLKVEVIEPLWQKPQEEIITSFINAGFEAIIVSTQAEILNKKWLGRKIDNEFLKEIKKLKKVDYCGENGEYHTLVINGPLFKKPLTILKAEPVKISNYWFLDIQNFH